LVLGGCEVRLLDHTNGYATIANNGIYNPATGILKIESRDGTMLDEYQNKSKRVVDEQANYELISILTDNNARSYIFGVNNNLYYPERQVACKTGTTNDFRDGWTMCATPQLAVGVWAGNNRGTMKAGADGSKIAAPITRAFIKAALKDTPAEDFIVPSKIKRITVDSVSGKLPTEYSTSTKEEVFADYAIPDKYDDVHIAIRIDSQTGQPATSLTPPQNITLQYYTVYHSEQPDNPNWELPVRQWMIDNAIAIPPFTPETQNPPLAGEAPKLNILNPTENSIVTSQPLRVETTAVSSTGIARVDLLVDGNTIDSLTFSPYNFTINKILSDGVHTIAIHAVDREGRSSDLAIPITIASKQLLITNPTSSGSYGQTISLEAVGGKYVGPVNFYINGELVGEADGVKLSNQYVYTRLWVSPGAGQYTLEAKSGQSTARPVTFQTTE
jgi:membrane carboxypeptidase/penicillin-binding protein PbpC